MQTIKDLLAACPAAVRLVLAVLATCLLCWSFYKFGQWTACTTENGANSGGVQQVTDELGRAGTAQQDITAGISEAAQTAGSVAGSISESAAAVDGADQAAGRVEEQLGRAGELISDCQRILGEVRARAEADATAN